MIRKLLLLLVVITILQNTSSAQQVSVLGNVVWDNTTETITVRIALRNNSNSSSNCEIAAMRIGYQFNEAVLSYAGFKSYFYNGSNQSTGLNDASYLASPILSGNFDPDHTIPVNDGTRMSGGKILRKNYINRSTTSCTNLWVIPGQTYRVAFDIYFKLKVGIPPSDYGLTTTGSYGFGSANFIAQFIGNINQPLSDSKKEIAILIDHSGSSPYQPFDQSGSSCSSGNLNPLPITDNSVSFIDPINGILSGKAIDANVQDRENHVLVQWQSENNQLVDYFEVQRKEGGGEFKTIGLVMGKEGNDNVQYEFKDKITARDVEPSYRIKVINNDKIITYSDVKKIRLGSEQSISVKVFPNPSSESIRINLPDANTGSSFVCRMYSTEGRIVKVTNVSAANPSVDIKSLSVGSYFMELYNPKSGKRFYTQFSKQ
jgi:hypothetical protein